MKKVHTPENVAHLFANQLQDEAKTQTGNLFFHHNMIFSYGEHFCIARHVSEKTLLFTERSYSNTTSKHIAHVRNAANHINKIFCYNPSGTHTENFRYWIDEAEFNIIKLKRANKPVIYLNNLDSIKNKAESYANFFNIEIPQQLKKALEITEKAQILEYLEQKDAYIKAEKKRKEKQAKKEHERALKKWRNFESYSLYLRDGYDYLRYNKEKQRFETSQRIEIPLQLGLKLYDKIKNGIKFEKVLDYTVKEINKNFVEIGCHKITIKEINKIIKTI
jgi:hypothetical protein